MSLTGPAVIVAGARPTSRGVDVTVSTALDESPTPRAARPVASLGSARMEISGSAASSPAPPRASAPPSPGSSPRRARRCCVADVQDDKGQALADELGGAFAHVDVTDTAQIPAAVDAAGRARRRCGSW